MEKGPKTVHIEDRLQSLKDEHGDRVSVDEIGEVVSGILATLKGDLTGGDLAIGAELRSMIDYIERTKDELAAMRPRMLSEVDIPEATDELDAIVRHTEAAAGTIMDTADELGKLSEQAEGAEGQKLQELATTIFEASSFQDITGQRITKVVGVLKNLEERLAALAEALGDDTEEVASETVFSPDGDVVDERALLHGPQLEGEGNSQDEIDAILADND